MMIIQGLFVLFCGLSVGSFVTLASYRLPRGEEIVVSPSRCPSCGKTLRFLDLWPVISWLVNKGKCRHCAAAVSVRYPLIELVTACLFLWIFGRWGFTPQGVLIALMTVSLMVMIVVDFEHYIIPDEVQWSLLAIGAAWGLQMDTPWTHMLGGFALGLGIGLALRYGFYAVKKCEGLGWGDVKFLAVAGLWLGFEPIVPFLFFSGLFGIATALAWRALGRGLIYPFGPALAAALLVCVTIPEITNLFWNMLSISKYTR